MHSNRESQLEKGRQREAGPEHFAMLPTVAKEKEAPANQVWGFFLSRRSYWAILRDFTSLK